MPHWDYFSFIKSFLYAFSPEKAHTLALYALRYGVLPEAPSSFYSPERMEVSLWDKIFPHPVGLAAGFDKDAEAIIPLFRQGFGFVEVGTVTPEPQAGNPKPRLFRLTEDKAVINRMGFNNKGLEPFVEKLQAYRETLIMSRGKVGANIGKNKTTEDPVKDYLTGLRAVYPYSDYITINISSPNTPGLRDLQMKGALDSLLGALCFTRESLKVEHERHVPLVLKIAPDVERAQLEAIVESVLDHGMDGMIVSNTTIGGRDKLKSFHRDEIGGLSGAPLKLLSNNVLRQTYALTEGKIPLIGVGGIASGQDAYDKILAGASMVQLYSALVYEGFGLVRRIVKELEALLEKDGFSNVTEAIGQEKNL